MPLKASVGLSRKVGQENYGSLRANCQLEIELDNALVNDAEAFHEKIRRLYALANQAVVDQLARNTNPSTPAPPQNTSPTPQNNTEDAFVDFHSRMRNKQQTEGALPDPAERILNMTTA